jgi:hypothetical protein
MKHVSCRLQNHDGLHPQRDLLAACLGSNRLAPMNIPGRSAAPEEPTEETIEDIVNKMGMLLATPEAKQKYFDLVIEKGFV